jgi:TIR domain
MSVPLLRVKDMYTNQHEMPRNILVADVEELDDPRMVDASWRASMASLAVHLENAAHSIRALGLELAHQPVARKRLLVEDGMNTRPNEYEYQVYLCHASQDREIVRRIRDRLEQNEIRCWFDENEMLAGRSARRRMEQGLLSSRYLLVCASSHLPSALWANQEIDAVLYLDVENQAEPKVLVIKLNEDSVETSIPPLLRGKKWLEYQRPGDFDHLVELLKPSS